MMENIYGGTERREFARLNYAEPLAYKVCNKSTISKILEGYISDISQAGLFCNIKDKVNMEDVLWLSFDRATLVVYEEIENRSLIYQNGIVGKVVRIEPKEDSTYDVGIKFITREEKNSTNVYSCVEFLEKEFENKNRQQDEEN